MRLMGPDGKMENCLTISKPRNLISGGPFSGRLRFDLCLVSCFIDLQVDVHVFAFRMEIYANLLPFSLSIFTFDDVISILMRASRLRIIMEKKLKKRHF